ncbi:uncharacterized protein LACBIDRAFT_333094 [Laccaria bicolor S238N-H82]|uniref:Predicted protein n=1 Tax=Laccaria bicolor (strain S238N-H82 / ATCC MYA-4686) TaxID=486041 RepID=B0DUU9_LACBS|nr:uncharacterized protein LACBIDRAFT_333094 [Laccaria bicolor S238N-H82]EDR01607.1 predicted protein [Laccaria bicolor S238N-H82]|eukprot:XP_001887683.1 predicted protein [Laccaria bicolor S238N-H82]
MLSTDSREDVPISINPDSLIGSDFIKHQDRVKNITLGSNHIHHALERCYNVCFDLDNGWYCIGRDNGRHNGSCAQCGAAWFKIAWIPFFLRQSNPYKPIDMLNTSTCDSVHKSLVVIESPCLPKQAACLIKPLQSVKVDMLVTDFFQSLISSKFLTVLAAIASNEGGSGFHELRTDTLHGAIARQEGLAYTLGKLTSLNRFLPLIFLNLCVAVNCIASCGCMTEAEISHTLKASQRTLLCRNISQAWQRQVANEMCPSAAPTSQKETPSQDQLKLHKSRNRLTAANGYTIVRKTCGQQF